MVAVVAGGGINGLGLFGSSLETTGNAGGLGLGALGQAGGHAYVNAVNGNLILRRADESVAGRGVDPTLLRTYNSQGVLAGSDGWRWDEHTVQFSGTVEERGNGSGTVTRTTGDGRATLYQWNSAALAYLSTDGDGAHDFVKYNDVTHKWEWTDGSTRTRETYGDSVEGSIGRLEERRDASGRRIIFSYGANGISQILDEGTGQRMTFVYGTVPGTNLTRLLSVTTREQTLDPITGRPTGTVGGASIKQVDYGYDQSGRLTSVKTVLNPGAVTASFFTTSYGYDAAGNVTSVADNAGFHVEFTYEQVPGSSNPPKYRVKTVTDAHGLQTFIYFAARTDVKLGLATDPNAPTWSYRYDAKGQLTGIVSPPPSAGAPPLTTGFAYDADGNLARVTDARGNVTVHEYDSNGNRTLSRDAEGNTVTRTYDSKNQLITETRYELADPDGAGTQLPSEPLTTRYVYSATSQLRFVISAEGRVTEHRYNGAGLSVGLLERTVRYTADLFDVSALDPTVAPSEQTMASWAAGRPDKSKIELTQYAYDLLGNLSRETAFTAADVNGAGLLNESTIVTELVYDTHSQLRQRIAVRGSNRDQRALLTSFTYDGLGRVLAKSDAGGTTSMLYDDANHAIRITTAAGLTETRVFDGRGRLVSVSQAGNGSGATGGATVTRETQYVYDAAGQLRMSQDAQGNQRFFFYDAVGRSTFQVDSLGAVIGYEYNEVGQLSKWTRYSNRAVIAGWYDSSTQQVTKDPLTVGGTGSDVVLDAAADRVVSYEYDEAGRLTAQIDAANTVTSTVYDGASRIIQQQTANRITRYLHDRDGRQIGVVDPLGFLTEHRYDAAGRQTETIRYTTRSPVASDVAAPVWVGITNQTAIANQQFSYRMPAFDADGDTLTFSEVGTWPAWVTLDKSGAGGVTLRGTAPATLTSYTVTVRANDGRGKTSDVAVTITVVNAAPSAGQPPAAGGGADDVPPPPSPSPDALTAPLASQSVRGASTAPLLPIDDGGGDPEPQPPQITSPSSATAAEGTLTSAVVYIASADTPVEWNLSGADASSFTIDAAGQVRFVAVPDFDTKQSYTFTLEAMNDVFVTTKTVTINLTNVAPSVTSGISVLVPEGATTAFYTAAGADPGGGAVTLSLSGADAALFTLDPATRGVRFNTAPDFETRSSYTFNVVASDAFGLSSLRQVTVNVANVAPTITSSATPPAVAEGTATTTVVYTAMASEPGGNVTFSLEGADASLFTIEATTGKVRFKNIPDYETKNSYAFSVRASDSAGASSVRAVTLNLTNMLPTITSGGSVSVPEGTTGAFYTASGTDPGGGTVSFSLAGADAALFTMDPVTKAVRFNTAPDFETRSSYTFDLVAFDTTLQQGVVKQVTVSVTNAAPAITSSSTPPAVAEGTPTTTVVYTVLTAEPGGNVTFGLEGADAALLTIDPAGQVRFKNVPDYDTKNSYSFGVVAFDAAGAMAIKPVTLTIANAAPSVTSGNNVLVAEGTTAAFYTASGADPGGGAVTFSLEGADAAAFTIDSTSGAVRFNTAPDFETKNNYSFSVRVTDAAGASSTRVVSVTVTNVAPTITSSGTPPAVTEGTSTGTVVYTATATDPGGGAVTFSLSGADAAAFTIDATTGAVRFKAVPDFETKSSYSFVVVAQDGSGGTGIPRSVTLNIMNAAPSVTSGGSFSVPEGTSTGAVVYTAMATDPGGGAVTFSLSGADAAAFTIDPTTGAVRFSAVPDFETKSSYSFAVLAHDGSGGSSTTFPVTVTVTNVAPTLTSPTHLISVWEGISTSEVVYRASAVDPGGPAATFSLTGQDAAAFTIDATTGEVRFNAVPNFQTRSSYTFNAVASDGFGGSDSRTLTLVVRPRDLAAWRPTNTEALHSFRYYDGQGRLIGAVDERGALTETVYNEQANTRQTVRYEEFVTAGASDTLATLKGRVGAEKQIVTVQFDDFGRVSTTTDPHGTVTRYVYDAAGRLIRQVSAEGTSEERATLMRLNAFGELTGTVGSEGAVSGLALDQALAEYGMRYEFDSLGRRSKAIDANGNATLFFYDSERLTHTVNAKGEVSETRYTSFGEVQRRRDYATRLTSAQMAGLTGGANSQLPSLTTSAQDRTVETFYDQRGLLTTTDFGNNFVTLNSYNEFGELKRQEQTIDPSSPRVATQFDYDLLGRLVSTTGDVGAINHNTQVQYDAYGRMIASVDGAGKLTRTEYKDSGRAIEVSMQVDGATRTVRTEYDAYGRMLKMIDPRGQATTYVYNDTARSVSVTTPEGITVTTTRTRHGETLNVVDGRGHTTAYEYNKDGQLRKVTDALGHVTENVYEHSGRLKDTIDARGVVTRFSYDALNRVFKRQVDPDGLNLTTQYEFNAFGQQMRVTEAVGTSAQRVTRTDYDNRGRLEQVIIDPDGLQHSTRYRYDGLGNTIKVERGTQSEPAQHVTRYEFDRLGRRVRQIEAPSDDVGTGAAGTRDLTTHYRYDVAGRVSRKIDANGNSTWFAYDEAGELTHTVNAEGEVSRNFYDANGRLVQTRSHLNRLSATTLASLGDVVSASEITPAQDVNDRRSYFVYDDDGRRRFVIEAQSKVFPNAPSVPKDWTISENIFDANGNVVETRRYDKFIVEERLDAIDTPASPGITQGEVVAELATLGYTQQDSTLANIRRTRHAYDAANQLRFTVDAEGSVIENVYDERGQVVQTLRFATRPTLGVSEFTESGIAAKVDRTSPDNQVTHLAYDTAGRMRFSVRVEQSNTQGVATKQLVTEQRYDALGQLVQTIAYATELDGVADYSETTLASEITASDSDRQVLFAYDAVGNREYTLAVAAISNGAASRYVVRRAEHNALGQLVRTTAYAKEITTPLSDFRKATLDAAVNAIASDEDRTSEFAYDKAGRLRFDVGSDRSLRETLYDAGGRVTERRQFELKVGDATPITEDALSAFRGNAAVGDGITGGEQYTYDRADRLRTTTDALGYVETHQYDALGNRTSFTDKNGNIWSYTYYRDGRVREEVTPFVDVQLSNETAPVRRRLITYFAFDALGNQTAREEAHGTVDARMTRYQYDRVGRQIQIELPAFDPATGTVIKGTPDGSKGQFLRRLVTTYDALGNVVRTGVRTGVSSFQFEYKTYDNLGQLKQDVDALGNVTAHTYNVFGEQLELTSFSRSVGAPTAGNGLWSASAIETVLNANRTPQDRTVAFAYDLLGREVYRVQVRERDAQGNATQHAVSQQAHNAFGEVVTRIAYATQVGSLADYTQATLDGAVITSAQDRTNVSVFDLGGRELYSVQALEINEQGELTHRVIRKEYDASGRLVLTSAFATPMVLADFERATLDTAVSLNRSAQDRATAIVRDAMGREVYGVQVLARDAQGNATQHAVSHLVYDGIGRVVEATAYATAVGPLADYTQATLDDAVIASAQDRTNVSVYNETGHEVYRVQVIERDAQGNAIKHAVVRMDYDAHGMVVLRTAYATAVDSLADYTEATLDDAVVASEQDHTTASVYDDADREVYRAQVVAYNAQGERTHQVVRKQYDESGRLIRTDAYATAMVLADYTKATLDAAVANSANRSAADRTSAAVYDREGHELYGVQVSKRDAQGNALEHVVRQQVFNAFGEVELSTTYAAPLTLADYRKATLDAAVSANTTKREEDRTTASVYDLAGQRLYSVRVSKRDSQGNAIEHVASRQVFNTFGETVKSIAHATVVGPLANYTKATLDGAVVTSAQDRVTVAVYGLDGLDRFTIAADGALSETVYEGALGVIKERRQFNLRVSAPTAEAIADPRTLAELIAARGTRAVGDESTRGEIYTYDGAGRMLTTTDAAGSIERYTHDGVGNRTTYTDKRGAKWTSEYDTLGRERKRTAPATLLQLSGQTAAALQALETLTEYDALSNLTTRTEAAGTSEERVTQYRYDTLGRHDEITLPAVLMQLSGEPRPTSHALKTRFEYDALGNIKEEIEAFGTVDARTMRYEYDTLGQQTKVIEPGYYDPQTGRVEKGEGTGRFERTREYTYNVFNEVERTAVRTAANTYQYDYKIYDARGLRFEVDALSQVTAYTPNVFGEAEKVTRYSVTVGAPTASNGLWSASELQGKLTGDARARTIETHYDGRGRKDQVILPGTRYYASDSAVPANAASVAQVTTSPTTKFEYNAHGDLMCESVKIDAEGTDAEGRSGHWRDTWHYFDAMGREYRTIDAAGYHTARTFDENGNLKSVTEFANVGDFPLPDSSLPPAVPALSVEDRITEYDYDEHNQQTSVKRYGLRYSQWNEQQQRYDQIINARAVATTVLSRTYDSARHVRTQTDALNNRTVTEYDKHGRVLSVTEPARLTVGAGADPFQNQLLASPVTTYAYGAHGQVRSVMKSPGGGRGEVLITLQEYDEDGNLTSITDANHTRLDTKGTSDPSDDEIIADHAYDKTFQYDALGWLTVEKQTLVVTAADLELVGGRFKDQSSTQPFVERFSQTLERRYAYDALGRQRDVLDVYTPATGAAQQSGKRTKYDAFGAMTEEFVLFGPASVASADLTAVKAASYEYDDTGKLKTKHAGEGVCEYYYDLAGNLTREEELNDVTSDDGAATRVSETGYDVLGRARMRRLPTFLGATKTGQPFTYAFQEIAPFQQQEFDRWGNMRSSAQGGYVEKSSGALRTSEVRTLTYDYNADNQLTAQHMPQVQAYTEGHLPFGQALKITHALRYDVLGRQVQELELGDDALTAQIEEIALRGEQGRRKLYNEAGQLTAEIDATGVKLEYVYDAHGNRIASRNAFGTVLIDSYDNNGNLTSHGVLRQPGGPAPVIVQVNRYKYDQANRRIFAADITNDVRSSVLGLSIVKEYATFTLHDERGAVRQIAQAPKFDSMGDVTLMRTYVYDQFGNKSQDTDALGNTQSWTYDSGEYRLGRLSSSTSGGRTTTYHYNDFGQLDAESTDGGAVWRNYFYADNGLLAEVNEHQVIGEATLGSQRVTDKTVTYKYDSNGQLAFEFNNVVDHFSDNTSATRLNQTVNTFYDTWGRLATLKVFFGNERLQQVDYLYDGLGNRRYILGDYENGDGSNGLSAKWYDYDLEGRVEVVAGELSNNEVIAGKGGTTVKYDAAGRRLSAQHYVGEGHAQQLQDFHFTFWDWDEYRRDVYRYDDLGYLTLTEQTIDVRNMTVNADGQITSGINGDGTTFITRESRSNDTTGRMQSSVTFADATANGSPGGENVHYISADRRSITNAYNGALGLLLEQSVVDRFSHSEQTFGHDAAGNLRGSQYTQRDANEAIQLQTSYAYQYAMIGGGLRETEVTANNSHFDPDSGTFIYSTETTRSYYDSQGNLALQTKPNAGGGTAFFDFVSDIEGRVVSKVKKTPAVTGVQNYFYAQGREVAVVGSGEMRIAQFSNVFTPISEGYPGATPGSYVVNPNDTLGGIAEKVWGDASLWYLIADANPEVSFDPDAPLQAIGRSLHIPNVVANLHNTADTFKPYSAAEIIGNSAPTPHLPNPPLAQCETEKQLLVLAMNIAVNAVVSSVLSPLGPVGKSLGSGSGELAGQALAVKLGLQKEIDWRKVGEAGISGGLGGAVARGIPGNGLGARLLRGGGYIATQQLAPALMNGSFDVNLDRGNLFKFGTDLAVAASGLDTSRFKFGSALSQLTNATFNPQYGAIATGDWESLKQQALRSVTQIVVGAGATWLGESIRSGLYDRDVRAPRVARVPLPVILPSSEGMHDLETLRSQYGEDAVFLMGEPRVEIHRTLGDPQKSGHPDAPVPASGAPGSNEDLIPHMEAVAAAEAAAREAAAAPAVVTRGGWSIELATPPTPAEQEAFARELQRISDSKASGSGSSGPWGAEDSWLARQNMRMWGGLISRHRDGNKFIPAGQAERLINREAIADARSIAQARERLRAQRAAAPAQGTNSAAAIMNPYDSAPPAADDWEREFQEAVEAVRRANAERAANQWLTRDKLAAGLRALGTNDARALALEVQYGPGLVIDDGPVVDTAMGRESGGRAILYQRNIEKVAQFLGVPPIEVALETTVHEFEHVVQPPDMPPRQREFLAWSKEFEMFPNSALRRYLRINTPEDLRAHLDVESGYRDGAIPPDWFADEHHITHNRPAVPLPEGRNPVMFLPDGSTVEMVQGPDGVWWAPRAAVSQPAGIPGANISFGPDEITLVDPLNARLPGAPAALSLDGLPPTSTATPIEDPWAAPRATPSVSEAGPGFGGYGLSGLKVAGSLLDLLGFADFANTFFKQLRNEQYGAAALNGGLFAGGMVSGATLGAAPTALLFAPVGMGLDYHTNEDTRREIRERTDAMTEAMGFDEAMANAESESQRKAILVYGGLIEANNAIAVTSKNLIWGFFRSIANGGEAIYDFFTTMPKRSEGDQLWWNLGMQG